MVEHICHKYIKISTEINRGAMLNAPNSTLNFCIDLNIHTEYIDNLMICCRDYRNNATKIIDYFSSINFVMPTMAREMLSVGQNRI